MSFDKVMKKRIMMSFLGVIILAFSVSLLKISTFGIDPFQTFVSGLDKLIPISFGTLYVIVNVVLLLFALIFDKHYIGFATFVNLFLLGYLIEFFVHVFSSIIVDPSLMIRIILLLSSILIICFGSSLYITADLGVSTYDAISLIISNTFKKGEFKIIRIITDLICVLVGLFLFIITKTSFKEIFSIIGLGTIITAFFMGPLIDYFNKKVSEPFLNKEI